MLTLLKPTTNKRVFLTSILSAGLLVLLTGCPYQSPYKIDSEPQLAIDNNLIGNWNGMVVEENEIGRAHV